MRRLSLVLAFALAACVAQPSTTDAGVDGSTSNEAGTSPCNGIRDVTNACVDVSCLGTAPCSVANAAECGTGAAGPGACVAGRCVYVESALGCAANSQCPCGICGADGRCYADQSSTCGTCPPPTGAVDAGLPLPCKSCLDGCRGAGPACCAGCGCLCEAECQKCKP